MKVCIIVGRRRPSRCIAQHPGKPDAATPWRPLHTPDPNPDALPQHQPAPGIPHQRPPLPLPEPTHPVKNSGIEPDRETCTEESYGMIMLGVNRRRDYWRRMTASCGPKEGVPMRHQSVAVVVPVYRGGIGLTQVVNEICMLTEIEVLEHVDAAISEIVLVCDNPSLANDSGEGLQQLGSVDSRIRIVWLSRNFGQHPATVAGIASTNADWIVTMDEDGQHNPVFIPDMLRKAQSQYSSLVYANPTEGPPHGVVRNVASRSAKRIFGLITGTHVQFNSFRLMEGAIARSVAAYVGADVYLDVALLWALGPPAYCPVPMRSEASKSAYSYRRLLSHFWRLVLSTGTRPLRLVAGLGALMATLGLIAAIFVVYSKLIGAYDSPGWASVMITVILVGGALLVAIAVLAEYVGYAVGIVMGKPLYVIAHDPSQRALICGNRSATQVEGAAAQEDAPTKQ